MSQNEQKGFPIAQLKAMSGERKLILGLAAALVVAILGMYGWKSAAVAAMEDRMAQAEAQQAEARAQLVEQARQLDARRAEANLALFSTPLAWSVRREAMAGNLDQVDQYFTELVQLPGFENAVLAKPDGKIVVASDRKQLAQPFASLYPEAYLTYSDIKVLREADGRLRAVIPILGLNQHLGTLVLVYAPAAFALQ